MLDSYFRKKYQAIFVNPWLAGSFAKQILPNAITYLACIFGITSAFLVFYSYPILASIFLIFSGYLDTIDGSIARAFHKVSDAGSALDIVLDRVVEFSIVFALFSIDPIQRAYVSLWIMGGILFCMVTFLVVGIFSNKPSEKSFYYSPGIIERTEAFLFFIAMICFPNNFQMIGWIFVSLMFTTSFIRIYQFMKQSPLQPPEYRKEKNPPPS